MSVSRTLNRTYTPEPWRAITDRSGDHLLIGPQSEVIARIAEHFRSPALQAANMERIALCVNACAGLSDAELRRMATERLAASHC